MSPASGEFYVESDTTLTQQHLVALDLSTCLGNILFGVVHTDDESNVTTATLAPIPNWVKSLGLYRILYDKSLLTE